MRNFSLELESGFAGGVREGGDPPGVLVATAVEDHLADARRLGAVGQERTDLAGLVALGPLGAPDGAVQRRCRDEGTALGVVHGRPLLGTADVLAYPQVPARLADPRHRGDPVATAPLEKCGGHFLPAV